MIEIQFTHRAEGVEETFSNDSRDTFVWEATDKNQRSFLSTFQDGMPRMVDLYRLAWITAKRLELVPKAMTLEQYAQTYTVEVDMEESTEPDPTQPAVITAG